MGDARSGILLVLCLIAAAGLGCNKRSARLSKLPPERKAAFAAPAWGPSTQGLQCRLRPTKRLWRTGETPAFKIDLRNQSKRIFSLAHEPLRPYRISVDGQWRQWPSSGPKGTKIVPLGPGAELTDLALNLPEGTARALPKGRHVIQIMFLFEGIKVVSNAVQIETVM
jgi:hypothetical protein